MPWTRHITNAEVLHRAERQRQLEELDGIIIMDIISRNNHIEKNTLQGTIEGRKARFRQIEDALRRNCLIGQPVPSKCRQVTNDCAMHHHRQRQQIWHLEKKMSKKLNGSCLQSVNDGTVLSVFVCRACPVYQIIPPVFFRLKIKDFSEITKVITY